MSDHDWCRDVRRDEKVRAAEDAAAVPPIQHRDLPEQVALLWASVGDLIGRVVRLEGEFDAGQDEEAAPAVCDSASPAEGLRTERVTLEVRQRAESYAPLSEFDWTAMLRSACRGRLFDGESVRVVDEERELADNVPKVVQIIEARNALADDVRRLTSDLAKERDTVTMLQRRYHRCVDLRDKDAITIADLTAERDAARRERDGAQSQCEELERAALKDDETIGTLRARVAELEAAAAPAANAGGVSNPEPISGAGKSNRQGNLDGSQEPVAWGVLIDSGRGLYGHYDFEAEARGVCDAVNAEEGWSMTVIPLYAAPPPRGWLTAEEREAIRDTAASHDGWSDDDQPLKVIDALLARSSPPRVRRPNPNVVITTVDARERIDRQWIAAIREAGGEVEG